MSKIGLYSPFLAENIGGGERYLLTVAQCLLPQHQVDLVVPAGKNYDLQKLKQKFVDNFHLELKDLNLVAGPFGPNFSSGDRKKFTKNYDVFYYMTDGSFFVSKAKLNVVHFMIPFSQGPALLQRWKLRSWPVKTANSWFTKAAVERIWKVKINYVHWGAVNGNLFKPATKTNTILNVGRFFSRSGNKHCKRQDVLVTVFKKMCDQGLKDWRLVLNGPVDTGEDNLKYFQSVKKSAGRYPISFHNTGSFNELQSDYGAAKIYWHAAGYGVDERTNPQAVEHLGMSTVEAMAAGAVPIVIRKGGQPEIVTHAVNGLLWNDRKQLVKQTKEVIASEDLRRKLSSAAQQKSREFSLKKFCEMTNQMFKL